MFFKFNNQDLSKNEEVNLGLNNKLNSYYFIGE